MDIKPVNNSASHIQEQGLLGHTRFLVYVYDTGESWAVSIANKRLTQFMQAMDDMGSMTDGLVCEMSTTLNITWMGNLTYAHELKQTWNQDDSIVLDDNQRTYNAFAVTGVYLIENWMVLPYMTAVIEQQRSLLYARLMASQIGESKVFTTLTIDAWSDGRLIRLGEWAVDATTLANAVERAD